MKKILVTGGEGQLGKCLQKASTPDKVYEYVFVGRETLDITCLSAIENFLDDTYAGIINAAAYTAVDKAEEEKEQAFAVNAEAVKNLAEYCHKNHLFFIHISTDYVFDGTATQPILPDAKTNPVSVYGASKLAGEKYAVEYCPDSIIIRTAWVYSPYGNNFVKTMRRLFQEREELSVVEDQKGCPTNAQDLAGAIVKIVHSPRTPGVYHFTNAGETNWYEFAKAIKEITKSTIKINPIPTSAYPTPAKRPKYSVLDIHKIQEVFGVEIPNWRESLEKLIKSEDVKK